MNHHIVVVEDNRIQSAQYRRVLEKAGFTVDTVDHALAAIDAIDKTKTDLIVADMLLTGSTLIPLLNELQSHPDLASIPVIIVTSVADRLRLSDLALYGVRAILDKTTMLPGDLVTEAKRILS